MQTPTTNRNSFLDGIRTVALLRVIAWHAYGYAWISYFIASMPAMFFVAGALMMHSLRRSPWSKVLYQRFRRLLIPLWALGICAVLVMTLYDVSSDSPSATFSLQKVVWWALPVWDPSGSEWGMTWWASLWYIRCVVWLFLASPLLVWAWGKVGPWILIAPLVALAALEFGTDGNQVAWQFHDFALYSFFWLLGFAYQDNRFSAINTRTRFCLMATFALLAGLWGLTQDIPAGIVNASNPMQLLVGLAWLFAALAIEGPFGRLVAQRRLEGFVYWINERALSIYLWQSAGLFAMYQLLWSNGRPGTLTQTLALPIVAAVTFIAVILFGWIEDIAAGRSPSVWPTHPSHDSARSHVLTRGFLVAAAGVGAIVLAVMTYNIAGDPSKVIQATAQTVPPSGAGLHLRALQSEVEAVSNEPGPQVLDPWATPKVVSPAALQFELDQWLQQWGIAGAQVSIQRLDGGAWTGASGVNESGRAFEDRELYWIASVTKTFTSTLVLKLAESGRLDLDYPVSMFLPNFPQSDRFTVRQLLQHTSGLTVGDENPHNALSSAVASGLQFEPGTQYLYSRSGYYMLALIIENVMGRSYTQALHEQLLEPLGLSTTFMDEELTPGPRSTHPSEDGPWAKGTATQQDGQSFDYYGNLWASGGIWSTTEDMSRWAALLWGTNAVLQPVMLTEMTSFLGKEFDYTGLGTYPFCPCWFSDDHLVSERLGFTGVDGHIEYSPREQVALAVHINGTIFDANVIAALDDLSRRFRGLLWGATLDASTEEEAASLRDQTVVPSQRFATVVIAEGDNLYSIAERIGVPDSTIESWVQDVLRRNGIEDGALLQIGQSLSVPLD